MTTYVLVHGAWGGGWKFARGREALRKRGHIVFTPTLTGQGERSHLCKRDHQPDHACHRYAQRHPL